MWKVPGIFTLCAVLSTFAHAEPFLPSFHMHTMESYRKFMESWAGPENTESWAGPENMESWAGPENIVTS